MADFDEDTFLDKHYPLLGKDEPDPGGWVAREKTGDQRVHVIDDHGRSWQGQLGWRRRHGPAITQWNIGNVRNAFNALLPDGTRGKVSRVLDHGFRRTGPGDPLWIYGDLEISDDDVRFVDGAQPAAYQPEPREGPSLEADLLRDQTFRDRIRDDRFACAVYTILMNKDFYKGDDPRAWSCSFRHAARLVAGLRGLGESYLDFYMSNLDVEFGPYPDDEAAIEAGLAARIPTPEKREEGRRQMIDRIAQRLPTTMTIDEEQIPMNTRDDVVAFFAQMEREADKDPRAQKWAADARKSLDEFRKSKGDPTMAEIKAHLTRLGWRRETPEDTKRDQKKKFAKRVDLVREIEALEGRKEGDVPQWAEHLREGGFGSVDAVPSDLLEGLSNQERQAMFPNKLRQRLIKLARTGRLTEDEYRDLWQRLERTRH